MRLVGWSGSSKHMEENDEATGWNGRCDYDDGWKVLGYEPVRRYSCGGQIEKG